MRDQMKLLAAGGGVLIAILAQSSLHAAVPAQEGGSGKFVIAKEVPVKVEGYGASSRLVDPPGAGARQLVVVDANIDPGKAHNFHRHPDQEEVVLVIAGKVEQWIGQEKRILGPGDSAFIPPNVVHASFNVGDQPAKIAAILGPSVGPTGSVAVDVSKDAPWSTLRK